MRASSSVTSTLPTNYNGPNTPRQSWRGHNKAFSPSGDWRDLAWVLRSSKGFTAAPLRAYWLLASLNGMATAQPPNTRPKQRLVGIAQYITGPSFLSSRTSIPGGVRGMPYKLSKTPATLVIDCSLGYCTASGTEAPSLGPKGFLTDSIPKP